jgi:uncharacterized protein YgiM (DUF1202 family)
MGICNYRLVLQYKLVWQQKKRSDRMFGKRIIGQFGFLCSVLLILCLSNAAWAWEPPLEDEAGSLLWYAEGQEELQRIFTQHKILKFRGIDFVRLGLRWDGQGGFEFEVRFSANGDQWHNWQKVQTTWHEENSYNGHADPPNGIARMAELRIAGSSTPSFLFIELIPELGPSVKGLPEPPTGQTTASLSGPFLPRSAWKAAAAKCQSSDPTKTRMAIHHTASPNNDSTSPEARIRGFQSYHQNTLGWCDIGYHLLISQDGRAWQGRPANLLGTHVANNNSKNLGISFIGTYTSVAPSNTMLCTGAKLIDWGVKTFGVARNRTAILGHREFSQNSTTCPGNALFALLGSLVTQSASSTCSFSPAPTPTCDYIKTTRLNGTTLNIREQANTSSKILGTVPDGTCLKVLSANANGQSVSGNSTWYKITHNNVTGWVSGYYADCANCGPPPNGTLQGFVFDTSDKNKRLSGVEIKVGGTTVKSAGTDGSFKLSLAPGTHALTATLQDYEQLSQQVKIESSKTTSIELGLKAIPPKPPLDTEPPQIEILSPADRSEVSNSPVSVKGKASDNQKLDRIEVNDKPAKLHATGDFEISLPLSQPGFHTIRAVAWDVAGNSRDTSITITYTPSSPEIDPEPEYPAFIEPITTDTHDAADNAAPPDREINPEPSVISEQGISYDSPTTKDEANFILDESMHIPCQTHADCGKNQLCQNNKCLPFAPAPSGGCACQNTEQHTTFWLLLLLISGLLIVSRRMM